MIVELISVGTEILLGNIVNTNAAYLAEQCANLGLSLYYQTVVGDNDERLAQTLETALMRSDIVIMSGGLGPTEDDLTKETAARILGLELKEDPQVKADIASFMKGRNIETITENNWKQALVPEGAEVIANPNGTAPGLILRKEDKAVVLLPGPPGELQPMFEQSIAPWLGDMQPEVIRSRMVKICGMGESYVADQIGDMIAAQTNPTIAPYAKEGEVHLRVTAKAADEAQAYALTDPVVEELQKRFGDAIYTTAEAETLEAAVVRMLKEQKLTIAAVESCTGGLLSAALVNVAGASAVMKEGFITYANEAKMELVGVKEETLKNHGAVSPQTAREMAVGGAKAARTDVSISVTGIAGPDGGTKEKPVGLVYIGCSVCGNVQVKEFRFLGSRDKIRQNSVVSALTLLRSCLLKEKVSQR